MFTPRGWMNLSPLGSGEIADSTYGTAEKFAINWKGFRNNIVESVEELHRASDFSDVTLVSQDGVRIRAHKLVLASGSKYFRRVLLEAALKADCCQAPIVILPGVNGRVLRAVVRYLYFGETDVDHDILAPFVDTAKKLYLKGLSTDDREHEGAVGLSMLSQSASPSANAFRRSPLSIYNVQPKSHSRDGDGLSILAQAAMKANERLVPSQASHQQVGAAKFGKVASGCRPASVFTNCGLYSSSPAPPAAENDENNPLNCCAMNLSAKGEPSPVPLDAQAPAYRGVPLFPAGVLPFGRFPFPMTRDLFTVPDVKRVVQAFEAPSSPTALDMSAYGLITNTHLDSGYQEKVPPMDGWHGNRMPGILQHQASIADQTLTTLVDTKPELENDEGNERNRKNHGKESETATEMGIGDGAGAGGNNDGNEVVEEDNENEAVPSTSGATSNEKNWKSRQPRGCDICYRMFSNKFNLKQHVMNMHTKGRTVFCELCKKKVKNKWYLRRHNVTHHNAPLKKCN